MIVLALDTTGPWCSAALVNEARILAHKSEKIGRGHAERLAPMVGGIMENAQIKASDINRISVCTGPGSFTGLRVALAFAKGFALPHKIPVIGLSALEVLAAQIDPSQDKRVVSIMDVRRKELCWAAYTRGVEIHAPRTQSIDDAKTAINALSFDHMVGDGLAHFDLENSVEHLSAPALAWLSIERTPQTHPAAPLYSRPPDAKLPGGIIP